MILLMAPPPTAPHLTTAHARAIDYFSCPAQSRARTHLGRRRQATNVAPSDVAAADSPVPSRLEL
jgi:hypothetical protein